MCGIIAFEMWKKLSTQTILNHPRLVVVEDDVELPNGHKTKYLRFESGGNTPTAIAFNHQNKILVLKEYSYPANEWLYQFPGGFVPEDENIDEGMNRELMEEAGLRADKLMLIGNFYPTVRRNNSKAYVFLANELIEEKRDSDPEEEMQLFWFTEQEIDNLILKSELKNGSSLAAWAIYKSYRASMHS